MSTMAGMVSLFVEPVVSVLMEEIIAGATKLKDQARIVIHFPEDFSWLTESLPALRCLLRRLEGTPPESRDRRANDLMYRLYKITEEAQDLVEDCQQCKNRRLKLRLRLAAGKKIKNLRDQIESIEMEARNQLQSASLDVPDHLGNPTPRIHEKVVNNAMPEAAIRRQTLRLASWRSDSLVRRLQPVEPTIGTGSQIHHLQRLLRLESEEATIVGVHGMGGAGKTVLAKQLWNSDEVQNAFGRYSLIWIPASNGPSKWLQREIVRQIRLPDFCETWAEEDTRSRIYSHLLREKYLMVLDDVRKDNGRLLSDLGVPFESSNSKIVITSCNLVALQRIKPDMPIFRMERLTDVDALRLLCRHAFGSGEPALPPEVKRYAENIVRKCDGHPLSLKTIGAAMVQHGRDPRQWQRACERLIELDSEEQIVRRLRLGYDPLRPTLKLCFLYFAAFPENQVIRTTDLIDLWAAERLVQEDKPSDIEIRGREDLQNLINLCLVETVEVGSLGMVRKCKMHHMLRWLALHIIPNEEKEFLFQAGEEKSQFPATEINEHRRVSVMYNHIGSLPTKFRRPRLRTLVLRHNEGLKRVPKGFLKQLESLRVLDLSMTRLTSLPKTVGHLKRLEHLNLSRTKLRRFPSSLTRLSRLQWLSLFQCQELEHLPREMHNLTSLRYLNLRRCKNLKFLPSEISKIHSLQCLIADGCNRLEWSIGGAARLEDLRSLDRLTYLSFWCGATEIPGVLMGALPLMERLELCGLQAETLTDDIIGMKKLRDLRLSRWERLVEVPAFISSLISLRRMTLEHLEVKVLPPTLQTLPFLQLLEIEHCNQLTELPSEFGSSGSFGALEELRLDNLKSLERLPTLKEGAMKMLKEFRVKNCEKVEAFPSGLERMTNLKVDIVGSKQLIRSLETVGPPGKGWMLVF